MPGLKDGLGFEEVGQAGMPTSWDTTGSVTAGMLSGTNVYAQTAIQGETVVGDTSVSGAVVYSATDIHAQKSLIHIFADGEGVIINNIPAEENISGGFWVMGSAASGTTISPVAKIGSWYMGYPLGICLGDTASGTASYPEILTRGFYQGLVAEDTIGVGQAIIPGKAVGVVGTVLPVASGTVRPGGGLLPTRGMCLMAGGSEAVVGVYLF